MNRSRDKQEEIMAARLGQWLDAALAEAAQAVEPFPGPDEDSGAFARRLLALRAEPSAALADRVSAVPAARRSHPHQQKHRPIWRRRWAAVAAAVTVALATVTSVPYTRNALADALGFEVVTTSDIAGEISFLCSDCIRPGPVDNSLTLIIEFFERVLDFASLGRPPLPPGTILNIGNGETIEVPAVLPDGFVWRGAIRPEEDHIAAYPNCAVGAPCPDFFPSVGESIRSPIGDAPTDGITPVYLVATDDSRNLLILSRVTHPPGLDVTAKAFMTAGPTTEVWMLIEHAEEAASVSFHVADGVEVKPIESLGPGAVAFEGAWGVSDERATIPDTYFMTGRDGITREIPSDTLPRMSIHFIPDEWNDTDGWANVIWGGRGRVYHLSARNVATEALIAMAEQITASAQ